MKEMTGLMLENFGVTVSWYGSTVEAFDVIINEADKLGFGYSWVPEAWGLEAFSLVSHILSRTFHIKVGTGIVNVFSRSAAVIGMGCATLQQIAPERFMLGLGSSGRTLVEKWHGLDFSKPLKRTEEYVKVVRKVVSGEEVEFQGEVIKSLSKFRLFTNSVQTNLEIYLGALGDANLRLAGEIADGAILAMYPSSRLEHAMKMLSTCDGSPKKLFTYLPTVISTSQELIEKEKRQAAKNIAFYVGSMGKYYAASLSRLGYETEITNILEAKQDRTSKVTEYLLSDLSLIGPPKLIVEKIAKFPCDVIPVFAFSCASKDEVLSSVASMQLLSSYLRTQ